MLGAAAGGPEHGTLEEAAAAAAFSADLTVVYQSNAPPLAAFEIETSMKKQLLIEGAEGWGGMPTLADSWGSKDDLFYWIKTKIVTLFTDPVCGNGICEGPEEYPQWSHSGCAQDCGYMSQTTDTGGRVCE